jgi:leader peptidase (prepilin peptidase)/N-methyltransferase
MSALISVAFFIVGLISGTVFYEFGIRIPIDTFDTEKSWHCPNCKEPLKWYDLIPTIFLLFIGKCPKCKRKFPTLYPFVQLLTALGFAMSYIRFEFHPFLFFSIASVSFAVTILVSDIRYQVIPNPVLILFLPVLIGRVLLFPLPVFFSHLIGLIVAVVISLIILLFFKGKVRFADWKYLSLIGFTFGWESFLVILVLSSIYALVGNNILLKGKGKLYFGPYISLAGLTALFYGQQIIDLVLNIF